MYQVQILRNEFNMELKEIFVDDMQLIAELLGTYFLIFAGCAAVVVNLNNEKVVTLPGISIVWGLAVMVLVYSIGHISGAHFNPAVTIAFATCKRFPCKQVNYTNHDLLFITYTQIWYEGVNSDSVLQEMIMNQT